MAQILDAELERAQRESLDALEVVGRLSIEELSSHREARIRRYIKEARFPDTKTLADFDWEFQPTLDKSRVLTLARLEFVARYENVLLGGNSGTGKSHIAKALGWLACSAGYRVRFTTCEALFRDLYGGLADHSVLEKLKVYTRPELLIIDDLGFEEIEITQAGNANLLLKVVNARYEKKSTIITSNIALEDWGKYLKDPVLAVAILDRFVHHANLFKIDGPSYRGHQSRQLNLLPPASEPTPQVTSAPHATRKKKPQPLQPSP